MTTETLDEAAALMRLDAQAMFAADAEVFRSVAGWLVDIATRHSPSSETLDLYLHYDSDEECEQCEDGGHPSLVCNGCFPQWDGMDGHCIYPCREVKAALTVALTYLGRDS